MESLSIPIDAIHSYYTKEREIYSRMVFTLEVDPARAMEVMAFWLWLEEDGYADIIRLIRSFDDDAMLVVVSVALNFIGTLPLDHLPNLDFSSVDIQPNLNFLQKAIRGINYYLENVCHKAFDDIRRKAEREAEIHRMKVLIEQMSQTHLDYVNEYRPFASGRGTIDLLKNDMVSLPNFAPFGYHEFRTKNPPIGSLYVPHGEGTSRSTSARRETMEGSPMPGSQMLSNLTDMEDQATLPSYPFNMLLENHVRTPLFQLETRKCSSPVAGALFNPNQRIISADSFTVGGNAFPRFFPTVHKSSPRFAGSWSQPHPYIPRDERTLFVTFSNGYPLTAEDLYNFFMRHYGDVELVTIHEPDDDAPPLYAHVSFYKLATVLHILDGNMRVKFMTKGKHLWARRFIPKRKFKLDV